MRSTERGWPILGLLLALAIGLLLVAAACGDDDDNGDGEEPTAAETVEDGDGAGAEADVEAAIQAAVDAWNGQDLETFLASFTDNGLVEVVDLTREQANQFLGDFIGQPPITLGPVTNIQVSGDTATAETPEFAFGAVLAPARLSFLNQDGTWLIDGEEEELMAAIPEGATAVDVTLTEYAFNFDPEAITDGNIAFNASNIGVEDHEIALFTIPADLDLEAAIEESANTGELPAGDEPFGVGGPWEPDTDTTMVFNGPLSAGRYAMLCFVENADGVPHFALGMFNEFTVE